jgi:tight adherence protein C
MLALLLSTDVLSLLVAAVALGGLLCMAVGLRYLLATRRFALRDRIQRTLGGSSATARGELRAPLLSRETAAIGPLARLAAPSDAEEMKRLRDGLVHAGFRGDRALANYLAAKIGLGIGAAALVLAVNGLRPQPLTHAAFLSIAAMALGFYLPSMWLWDRRRQRQRALLVPLPNALDLLVTCVEAGLGLEAALQRVAEELRLGAPLLADELTQVVREIEAGMNRTDAFRRLAARTGVDELRGLSAIIIQTQMFGTSVARALRVQADALRVRRMQAAETRAATVSVKMKVPLIFCILPALFAVIMGPAAINIVRVLLPTLQGGN